MYRQVYHVAEAVAQSGQGNEVELPSTLLELEVRCHELQDVGFAFFVEASAES